MASCLYLSDLNKLFQGIMPIATEKAIKHNVRLSWKLQDEQDEQSLCSYGFFRLQQALLNLINNAVEASPAEEEVIIRSKIDSNNLVIEVEDNGEGISPDKIDENIQPFVSSKKEGTVLAFLS